MSNETVTYSLEAILTRIESKIDRIDERLTKLEIGQAELKAPEFDVSENAKSQ